MPHSTPENLQVLYEDNHLIAINKRASDLVQPDDTGDAALSEVVTEWLRRKYQKPGNIFLGTLHRLDRPVSGVVLFGKTSKASSRMSNLFRERKIEKTYWAVTVEQPPKPEDRLIQFLKKDREKNKSFVTREQVSGAKKAELSYLQLAASDRYYLLQVKPHTQNFLC